ncbi:MAG: conjugal transfer protein TrbJ [Brevundimonas sp.]|jgi:P-type conjugative transfer protein TrbJ|uniref:conjugal transfer protein TrbJ n=1 Tax=Brevundimonas sp. TaxID=1871086 RepID=UPI0025C5FB75|nr:conjugal transfer protein TrbJ [Brevundimonas sp.]MCH4267308.1 conjugal transfer protein TrbJ [Brevundimonas sp.]
MWIPFSTPSPRRLRPNRPVAVVVVVSALLAATTTQAQQVVFDPRNHLENALQAARQLESLANEAKSLAASPYSHLAGNSQALQDMAELARTARGLATSVDGLERQFADLYPDDLSGTDALRLVEQSRDRSANARRTAEDLARTAAHLERMGQGRGRRLSGALEASQSASGQTAAVQSSNQMLAVLAEDLAALRIVMLAQARLLSEGAARDAAERAAGVEARCRIWSRPVRVPNPPAFDPLSNARN